MFKTASIASRLHQLTNWKQQFNVLLCNVVKTYTTTILYCTVCEHIVHVQRK